MCTHGCCSSGLASEAWQRGEFSGHSSRTERWLTTRRAVPMGDTPRKALSASVGSSSVKQCEWCGFVRVHRVSIAPHHANVAHSPTRLSRQPTPPNSSTWARWNRLEQPELTSQAAVGRGEMRGRPEPFVRAGAMRVNGSRARQQCKFTDRNFLPREQQHSETDALLTHSLAPRRKSLFGKP